MNPSATRSTLRRRLGAAVALVALITTGAVAVTAFSDPAAVDAVAATSKFVPISPVRVLSTRDDVGGAPIGAGEQIVVAPITAGVAAAAGVDAADVTAVVMNVTALRPTARGFVRIWPAGEPEPGASVVNPQFPNHVVANLATIPLGVAGELSIYSDEQTDLILDVQGVYVAADTATSGRFVALPEPARAIDTRPAIIDPNTALTIDLSPSVPRTASAAILNVTSSRSLGAGFYTVWPDDGSALPIASNLNVPAANANIANQVYSKVTDGRVRVFTDVGGAVIVDVLGYMTGADGAESSAGLFVPVTPQRLLSTRIERGGTFRRPLEPDGLIDLDLAGRGSVPAVGAGAVVMNVTAAPSTAAGYVAVEPAGTASQGDRTTSTLNHTGPRQAIPNHVSMRLNEGAIQVYSQSGTGVIVDVTGYFTDGSAEPPPPTPPIDTVVAPPTTRVNSTSAASGSHGFLLRSSSFPAGFYARWNGCESIRYIVNRGVGAAVATDADVVAMNEAIAFIEQATGFDLVFAGETTEHLNNGRDLGPGENPNDLLPEGVDAVLGFGSEATTEGLEGVSIGVGGAYFDGSGRAGLGFAYVDLGSLANPTEVRTTFMHEIGHMVGLAHVIDADELMFPNTGPGNTTFGDGDLEGLWRVGLAQGCSFGNNLAASGNLTARTTETTATTATGTVPAHERTGHGTPDSTWTLAVAN